MTRIGDLGIFFLASDEPRAPVHWRALAHAFPRAVHVRGAPTLVTLAERSSDLAGTDRFITVYGDTGLEPAFAEHAIDDRKLKSAAVISWPCRNHVNELRYPTGAVRCWSRRALLGGEPTAERPEIVEPRCFATTYPDSTPSHAFRAGFREGVRLGLVEGRAPGPPHLGSRLSPANARRLSIWASLGADAENGLWCVYGARLACRMIQLEGADPAHLTRPDRIERLWRAEVAPRFAGRQVICPHSGHGWDRASLEAAVVELGELIRRRLGLEIIDLDAEQSRFFKSVYARGFDPTVFDLQGNCYLDGQGLLPDPQEAALNYEIGAIFGSSNAANNLARMYREGVGMPRDLDMAQALLSQATSMGNPFAAFHLARMHLGGWLRERDTAKAATLFLGACRLGFKPAHVELGRLYLAGEGVACDPEQALMHFLLAEELAVSERAALEPRLSDDQRRRARRRARSWHTSSGRDQSPSEP